MMNELLGLDLEVWEAGEMWGRPIFLLYDPLDFNSFSESARDFLPPIYQLVNFTDEFAPIFDSMQNFEWLSELILWATAGASVIIIALLITLYLKDRKSELGIYLALGEKRSRLYLQIFTEVFGVAIIGITLSLVTGRLLADGLSQNMLMAAMQEREMAAAENEFGGFNNGFIDLRSLGFINYEVTTLEVAEIYHISLELSVILAIYAVGLTTIFIASVIPLIYVTNLNPKKILM